MSANSAPSSHRLSFRQFFFRGLGILLPTVLTIWILVAAYNFVDQRIASHLNRGVRWTVLTVSGWPPVNAEAIRNARESLTGEERAEWIEAGQPDDPIIRRARVRKLEKWWNSVAVGDWAVLDLTGLILAILLIYLVGRILGGFIGHRLYAQGELLLRRIPIFRQIYPYVKQVTDFFVGDKNEKLQFNRVVAVQYPRKGIWSVGLVTGETMRNIQTAVGENCMTIFIPSSPTPFTGYVITVPREQTLELPITIDEALRFVVSGGVIVPDSQAIDANDRTRFVGGPSATPGSTADPESTSSEDKETP